jgi:insertion element IS1 protein InsB
MTVKMICPTCGSHEIAKNATTRRSKQNYQCRDGSRHFHFIEDPPWKPPDKDRRGLIAWRLLENRPLAGIARAKGVAESCLQNYKHVVKYCSAKSFNRALPARFVKPPSGKSSRAQLR